MTGVTEPFSLLMAVYANDVPDYVERAFRSAVEEQQLPPDQVVLVEDGPLPSPLRERVEQVLAASSVPVERVIIDENQGLANALNLGLRAARYEIVARMDADDVARPGRFRLQLPLFDEGYDLVGAGMLEFMSTPEGDERILARRVPPESAEDIARQLPKHSPFNHPTVVYRRSSVLAAGGYQQLGLMEDYWLWARMIALGARACNVSEPLVLYRVDHGAFARRGGWAQLRTEIELQRRLRSLGLISRGRQLFNTAVRGGYRLVPERVRRPLYRTVVARNWRRAT